MTALTPGLYRATVRGVPDQIVMVHEDGTAMSVANIERRAFHKSNEITDARPLIVLDLPDQLRTISALRSTASRNGRVGESAEVHWLANLIEAQCKPARIPEPGLWGVVEARWPDNLGGPCHWVHDEYGWASRGGPTVEWRNLIDPTLVRDGVS